MDFCAESGAGDTRFVVSTDGEMHRNLFALRDRVFEGKIHNIHMGAYVDDLGGQVLPAPEVPGPLRFYE